MLRQEIIKFIQGDIPVVSRPYCELAQKLEISEQDVIAEITALKREGLIRRLGAILRHQKAGYTVNALVAWKVEPGYADRAGEIMAQHPQISHCYLRQVPQEFPYNVFSMIHSRSEQELEGIIENLVERTGIDEYIILPSVKELKKISLEYY